MTQRTLAGIIAAPLLIALWVVAASEPLPYVTYEPGLTVNVLGSHDGEPIIEVAGHRTYPDQGELRMTTVYVSQPRPARVTLAELMKDWISKDAAVYPYKAIYRENETNAQSRQQGAVEMVSSQDTAAAVALDQLGYQVKPAVEVLSVLPGTPADGRLQVRDIFLKIDGKPVTSSDQVVKAVQSAQAGQPVHFVVRRDRKPTPVTVTPRVKDGTPVIGIQLGLGYRFPFKVRVNLDQAIGGPSAGLMFSLGIYDTLTPGSLTDGRSVAGTGTIDESGKVGPIGGIQQKIAAARRDGAQLFLVPPDNCKDALGAQNGDMRLVKAETMPDALQALKAWDADPDAPLPSCKEDS
ncbi:YlbL family protein [Nocardioides panaciterrulae]|uniref:endopeptidase La n=1 Tax=Nocardioides panaciterrulae TaxID=661492 RepID=A0A7Y9E4W2_9ACTN|nr:PDZ domain-containing protein [Nocardioides panaciterrulae]NYD41052.1 PDZ domain-containing protein [Nocardioides panaciterrulae]